MEVHAHSHTARNKWTHYLWEFLMLFLAVFCGFLAENYREHQVEKARGLQYIRSFYNDLKTDTAEFARIRLVYEGKMAAFSKRDECFNSISTQSRTADTCINDLIKNVLSFPDFLNADQTMLQLKNAGGLRLLGREDADTILNYDMQIRAFISFETTGFQQRQYRIREFLYTMLNYRSLMSKMKDPAVPVFLKMDPARINEFFVMLNEYANASNGHLRSLILLDKKAKGIIAYFRNKYHYE